MLRERRCLRYSALGKAGRWMILAGTARCGAVRKVNGFIAKFSIPRPLKYHFTTYFIFLLLVCDCFEIKKRVRHYTRLTLRFSPFFLNSLLSLEYILQDNAMRYDATRLGATRRDSTQRTEEKQWRKTSEPWQERSANKRGMIPER